MSAWWKRIYSVSAVSLMLCGLAFGQDPASAQVAEQPAPQQSVLPDQAVSQPAEQSQALPAEQQTAAPEQSAEQPETVVEQAAEKPAIPQDVFVLRTDSTTGQQSYVRLEGDPLPGETLYVSQIDSATGEYVAVPYTPPAVVSEPPAPQADTLAVAEPEIVEPQVDTLAAAEPEPEPEQAEPELAAAPVALPPPSPEMLPWYKTFYKDGKNYITTQPVFFIANLALGIVLGMDGTKSGLNESLETQLNDVYLWSEMFLRTRGRATITSLDSWGFGFTLQYERQILPKFALMGRFSYSGLGMAMKFDDNYIDIDYSTGNESCANVGRNGECLESTDKFSIDLDYYNWSIEIHSRYYPRTEGSLFLDGVIGFGSTGLSVKRKNVVEGDFVVKTPNGYEVKSMKKNVEVTNVPASRGYMVIGPMVGWRETFGKKPGQFVWETSIGYLAGIGFSDPLADKIIDENIELPHILGEYNQDIDDSIKGILGLIESIAVVGGPRIRMSIGWAF